MIACAICEALRREEVDNKVQLYPHTFSAAKIRFSKIVLHEVDCLFPGRSWRIGEQVSLDGLVIGNPHASRGAH